MFCVFTARFVSDLVGNPEDMFSHKEAHIKEVEVLYYPSRADQTYNE